MTKTIQQRAEQQQQALLLLNKKQWLAGHEDILDSIQLATDTASKTLNISRCSVWLYGDAKSSIKCIDLFDAKQKKHDSGAILSSKDFPHYFEALYSERIIAAGDAHTNKFTYEFSETYLTPLGISSMLDAPIWLRGETIGVLCCEHVGKPREWEIDEMNFAASVADFASIAFELSEHKKTSDELRQHKAALEDIVKSRTQELKDINDDLLAFNHSVSHDLRAPLRHMGGYLKIIEEDYLSGLDETGREYFEKAQNSLLKMNSLIDSMLHLSRISTQKINKSEINLSEILREIAAQHILQGESLTLKISDTPNVTGDKNLLRIVLTNLFENALKYSQHTTSPLIEFTTTEDNSCRVFLMRDNGCGFNMDHADKLFNVFQRLHSQQEYEGTGIGLSTVQRIIQKHDGKIWAESEANKGATFYFYLNRTH